MPKEVCRALITDESGMRLLLAKRADHDEGAGLWCAFGGKIDDGESPEDAVIRETEEEAGLILKGVQLYDQHANEGWLTYFYEASATGELVLNLSENSEAAYFSEDELGGIEIAFDHFDIYKGFLRSRQFIG